MCVVSALFSWSLTLIQMRFERLEHWLNGMLGAASLGFGIYLAYSIGAENFFA